MERSLVEVYVQGGLKDCINMHGPITYDFIPSASKRILGRLFYELENLEKIKKYANQDVYKTTILNLRQEIQELQTENRLLRDRMNKKRIFEHKKPIGNLSIGLGDFLNG